MCPTVVLKSGDEIEIRQIMLFQESEVSEIFRLKAEAAKALGPSGTAVGVFGAPSLTLAAEAAALGILSSIAAAAAQKTGLSYLAQATQKASALRTRGVWINIEDVQNLDVPAPEIWHAFHGTRSELINIGRWSKEDKRAFLEKHGLKYEWGAGGMYHVPMPVKYVHSGDDFIRVKEKSGEQFFRWSQVCSYCLD